LKSFHVAHLTPEKRGFHVHSVKTTKKPLNRAFNPSCRVDRVGFLTNLHEVQLTKNPERFRYPSFWLLNSVICLFFGIISLNSRLYLGESLGRSLCTALTASLTTLVLFGLLRLAFNAPIIKSTPGFINLALVALFSLLAACLHATSIACVTRFLNQFTTMHWHFSQWAFPERLLLLVLIVWPMYLGWSLGYFWVRAELRIVDHNRMSIQSKTEAQRMELQLLRFQLDPHFLLNSLNGILSEIPSDPEAAMEMVLELSSYLKYSLDQRGQMITRLSSELDATDAYLKIQKARFGERLQTRIEATQSARTRSVPSFILQPLVENAFIHGFSSMPSPWLIELVAETNANNLTIKVINNGVLKHSPKVLGVGLESIVGRLEIHYPERHQFTLEQEGDFVVATLALEGDPCNV
jgi:ABC-type multidrug transport system fused ATPase/permease subunit